MTRRTEESLDQTEERKAKLLAEAQAVLDAIEPLVEALFQDPANRNLPPTLVISVAVMVYREGKRRDAHVRWLSEWAERTHGSRWWRELSRGVWRAPGLRRCEVVGDRGRGRLDWHCD